MQLLLNFCLLLKRFPFDSSNPIGYLIAFAIEYIMLACQYFAVACTLGLGIGAFSFATATIKEIQRIAPTFNDEAKANVNLSNKLKAFMSEFIDGHGTVKKLRSFEFTSTDMLTQ